MCSRPNGRCSGRISRRAAPRWIASRANGPSSRTRSDWKQAKPLLDELRSAQDKAEAIAHTIDEQPAAKILATEAAPLAKLMLQKATVDHRGGRRHCLDGCAQEPVDRLCRHARQHGDGDRRDPRLSADGRCGLQDRVRGTLGAQPEEVRRTGEAAVGDDGRSAEGVRRSGRSPRQVRAAAAEDVRYPRFGPLEHGAMVPDQRGGAPRQQAARHLRRREGCARLAFGRHGCAAAGQSEEGWRRGSRGNRFPDDACSGCCWASASASRPPSSI